MSQENTEEDVLAPLKNMDYQNSGIHMKTYTAGEDGSRLAQMAKEFGLAHQRQPRQQVRERVPTPLQTFTGQVIKYGLDPGFADVRMRAVYTSQGPLPDDDDFYGEMENEGQVDPHAQGVGGDLTSSVLGIIKAMVGPAILYLPHGFATAGYVVALPIMAITTCLFLYSSTCLLESWRLESTKGAGGEKQSLLEQGSSRKKRIILSYPELAYRALGPTGEMLVKLGIALMQSGVCLTYLIFVPQNLSTCADILFNLQIPPKYLMIVMLVCQIPLSWIRDIRKLTITNLLANLLILYGLITCIFFALNNAVKSEAGRGPLEEIRYKLTRLEPFNSGWFLFIGTSVRKAMYIGWLD
jgi:proton-coupled amino acid transporter